MAVIWRIAGSLLLVLALSAWAWAEELTGRVVGVSDGDTLTLLVNGRDQVKVRLAWIDAPETGQPYGQQAKQALSALVFGREVLVTSSGHDRYGRTLGVVTVAGVDVQAEQVWRGLAWVYRQYPHPPELETLEAQAQAAKRGLWALQADQRCSPWNWRRKVCVGTGDPPPPGCGAKRTCREMSSCEEARYLLTVCGVRSLDGDGDGTPCNRLCR